MKRSLVLASFAFVAVAACGKPEGPPPQYPPLPEGCAVQLFHGAPNVPTDNIGPAMARCDARLSEQECQRELMDQACKLGGDVVWGVTDKPELKNGKQVIQGRVAHSKAAP